jgi:chaperone required for assembly of F1-ATPase
VKRFWQTAAATPQAALWGVALDGKPLRTPARAALLVPTAALAHAIADEWNAVADRIDPRAMPLTGLANAAIDRVMPDAPAFAARLAAWGQSELIAYRADGPPSLVAAQAEAWDSWAAWFTHRHDASLAITTGVMHVAQPAETLARIAAAFAAFTPFQLAALDPVVTITGSAVLALAVADGAMPADAAYDAAHVDARWQAQHWGEDALAQAAEAARRAELGQAARFLQLLAG